MVKFTYGIRTNAQKERILHIKIEGGNEWDYDIKGNDVMFESIEEDIWKCGSSQALEDTKALNEFMSRVVEKAASNLNLDIIFC